MKNIWKALGIATLAAVVPVTYKKDEETGKRTFQSLFMSLDIGPGKAENHINIGLNIGDGVIPNALRRQQDPDIDCYADEELERSTMDMAQEEADEAQDFADEAQDAADEEQAAAAAMEAEAKAEEQAAAAAMEAEEKAEEQAAGAEMAGEAAEAPKA